MNCKFVLKIQRNSIIGGVHKFFEIFSQNLTKRAKTVQMC